MALAEYNLETPDSDAALAALPARVGRSGRAAPAADAALADIPSPIASGGLAPGFERDSVGVLRRNGRHADTSFGAGTPAWIDGATKPAAPSARPPVANILPRGDITKAIVERAAARGMPMPQHVAEGITDRIFAESGGNPMAYNPNDVNGPSGGLYQAHNERLTALQKYAAAQGRAWTDPYLQIDQMLNEYAGGDAVAARHRAEVWGAPTREAAAAAHDRYFERSAGGVGGGTGDAEFSRMQQEGRAGISDLSGKIDRLMAEAGKAAPGSEERRKLMDRLLTHSDELSAKFEKLSDHPPKSQSPFEAMSEWAPLMIGLVALAGMKTARPAYGALNAAGAALGALKQGNDEGYKNAMEVWSKQTEMAHKAYQMQNEELRVIMEDERLSEAERHNKFEEALRAFGMERDLQLMKQGLSKDAYDNVFKRKEALDKHDLTRAQIDEHRAKAAMGGSSNPAMIAYYKAKTAKEVELGRQLTEKEDSDLFIQSTKDVAQAKREPSGNALISDEDATLAAEQYLAGDRTSIQGWGRGAQGDSNRAKIRSEITKIAKTRGWRGGDIAAAIAEFEGEKSGERVLGNREATLRLAANVTEVTIPLLQATSDKIDRTEFPTLNSAIIAVERGTGNTDVVRFIEQLGALRYVYARALNPTGQPRVEDMRRVDEMIGANWTKGQINAVLDQIKIELGAEKKALDQTKRESRDAIAGRANVAPPTPAGAAAGASHDSPATPKTKDEYLALPKGAWYRDADGNVYQKQSDAVH